MSGKGKAGIQHVGKGRSRDPTCREREEQGSNMSGKGAVIQHVGKGGAGIQHVGRGESRDPTCRKGRSRDPTCRERGEQGSNMSRREEQ